MSGPDSFDDFLAEVGRSADDEISGGGGASDDIAVVLDSIDAIQAADPSGTLWALATSGSQVRRAVAASVAWSDRLSGFDRPRAVLVAADSHTEGCAHLLTELGGAQAPVIGWAGAELPRWAGPADVLLATSLDGMNPRIAAVVAEADRRGLSVVLVSPEDSPVAAAAGHAIRVPLAEVDPVRTAAWSATASLLVAAAALGVVPNATQELAVVADALDEVAARCGPSRAIYENEAKQLALDLGDADAVLLGCGALASAAARQTAQTLIRIAGVGALAVSLPDQLASALSLLRAHTSASAEADFFRDRVNEVVRTLRLVTFNPAMTPPLDVDARSTVAAAASGPDWRDTPPDLIELASARATARVREAAARAGVRYSVVEPQVTSALAGYAHQVLLGEFVAAYLAIGRGLDPDFDPGPA